MARRRAGTESAFTIGLRMGNEVGSMISQTAAVLTDRADKKKAEQVQVEFNQKMEEIRAPLTALENQARTIAKDASEKGQDIPPDVALKLRQDIRTAKVEFMTNKLDLALTYQGSNPDNKYVKQNMGTVVDGTLAQLQATSAMAQQENALNQQQWERDQAEQKRSDALLVEGAREEGMNRRFRLGEEGKDRRAKVAAEADRKPPQLSYADVAGVQALVEKEAQGKTDEFWSSQLEEMGLDPTPTNLRNFQAKWTAERMQQMLADKYDPEQIAHVVPTPEVLAEPPDADTVRAGLDKEALRRLRASKYPGDQDAADLIETSIKQREAGVAARKRGGALDPKLIEAREYALKVGGESAVGWLERLGYYAKQGVRGAAQAPEARNPSGDPYSGNASPAAEPEPDAGDPYEDVENEGEPPIGAELQNDVEADLVHGLGEVLPPEERKMQLNVRRTR